MKKISILILIAIIVPSLAFAKVAPKPSLASIQAAKITALQAQVDSLTKENTDLKAQVARLLSINKKLASVEHITTQGTNSSCTDARNDLASYTSQIVTIKAKYTKLENDLRAKFLKEFGKSYEGDSSFQKPFADYERSLNREISPLYDQVNLANALIIKYCN